jgi:hypothetical protein
VRLILSFYCLFFVCWSVSAQQLRLQIAGANETELKRIDSVGYIKMHKDVKSIKNELGAFSEKLTKLGFIENKFMSLTPVNDSIFESKFSFGSRTNFIHIYIGRNFTKKSSDDIAILRSVFEKDSIKIGIGECESFLNTTLGKLEKKGFALSGLKLINFKKCYSGLCADLDWDLGKKRFLNDIVINGYEKFSKGHLKSLRRLYRKKEFNQALLKKLNTDVNQFRFVRQTKFPEILFTQDTTKVYVYIEKAKPNRFDGLIGFANSETGAVRFNGYLDLLLVNFLNSGEGFNLLWKSDGKSQTTFNTNLDLPYLFKTPFGLKANLTIFKQDSIFQNTKTAIELGYLFHYNSRVYLGRQTTSSAGATNSSTLNINDFNNSFTTLNYEYSDFNADDLLFPEKSKLLIKAGIGSRKGIDKTDRQNFIDLKWHYNFYFNKKNLLNIRSQNFYLKSDRYFVNELYRFGGINSLRGFNENSLQAHFLSSLQTEYRYIFSPSLYTHSVIDYGWFKDATSNRSSNLLGLGFGFGLQTKNGLFNLIYATGTEGKSAVKLNNAIVQMSFITNF